MNGRVLRPLDNVFTAVGASKDYNINNKTVLDKVLDNIAHVNGNQSLSSWLENNWLKGFLHTDPAGIILFENDGERIYPTYKDIFCIRDYGFKGQNTEWVMFEPYNDSKGNRFVRFIDGEYDQILAVQGERLIELEDEKIVNILGECPAIINSKLTKAGTDIRLTPIWNVIEAEKEYLRDQSILTIVKFLEWFPKPCTT